MAHTKNQLLTELYGIFKRAQESHGLQTNPAALVGKRKVRPRPEIEVYSSEEVRARARRRRRHRRRAVSDSGLHWPAAS
jgi:hypothetical protein